MRRSLLASIGAAAVFILAACSPDQSASREPLAPTTPSLAQSQLCSGQLASNISKQQKDLFENNADPNAYPDLQDQFAAIKSACPNVTNTQLFAYLDATVLYGAPTTDATFAQNLVNHWASLVLYVKNETESWDKSVVMGDEVWNGVPDGAAGTLTPGGDPLETYDHRARLSFDATTVPSTPHFFTFQPSTLCQGTTSLKIAGNCYNVKDYPHETSYLTATGDPAGTITLCLRHQNSATTAIVHQRSASFTEVLPVATDNLSCSDTHTSLGAWLERQGTLGGVVAKAYNFLAPRPLYADDAGESGSIGLFSLVGGAFDVVLQDDFSELVSPPDVGDSLIVEATSPGYIKINQAGIGSLTGPVVELSQAQGNCANCPTFRLLASRVNSATNDDDGTYEVEWQALQAKPNIKEAPFFVLDGTGKNAKVIAKLSLVTESNQNFIKYNDKIVRDANNQPIFWTQNQHLNFKITIRLIDLDDATVNFRTALAIGGTAYGTEEPFVQGATTFRAIGFVLTGIDAGIIASDNWKVTRLSDNP
jgi:hypothetical protein